MFLDASALVAILRRELGFETLVIRLQQPGEKCVTPFVVMEAGLAMMRETPSTAEEAFGDIEAMFRQFGVRSEPLTNSMILAALQAHERYGKGREHPARLNMGDCLSYAAARTLGLPLLYKGKDFARTDIPPALPA